MAGPGNGGGQQAQGRPRRSAWQRLFYWSAVLAVWGLVIAAILLAGMLPLFLGLFIALPVLGHASWHMYRQLMPDDE